MYDNSNTQTLSDYFDKIKAEILKSVQLGKTIKSNDSIGVTTNIYIYSSVNKTTVQCAQRAHTYTASYAQHNEWNVEPVLILKHIIIFKSVSKRANGTLRMRDSIFRWVVFGR